MRKAILIQAVAAIVVGGAAQAQSMTPDYYPQDYAGLVEASRNEPKILVYTNVGINTWKPTLAAFNAKFPWIEVEIADLGAEVFARYYAESATGGRTPDLIVSGGADLWAEFVARGNLEAYRSAETGQVPDWSKPYDGVYTFTIEPAVIAYNKLLIHETEVPKSVHALADLAKAKPDLAGKITTLSTSGPFGRAGQVAWIKANPNAWDVLGVLGPITRPERTTGPLLEKLAAGEYAIGWNVTAVTVFDRLRDPALAQILGWTFATDGTPMVPRFMAIPSNARNKNAAKVLLDFLMSHDGQTALGKAGATVYRPDVPKADVAHHTFSSVVDALGSQDKVAIESFRTDEAAALAETVDRWGKTFVRP